WDACTVVDALAVVPSANVAVSVNVAPPKNCVTGDSDAKTVNVPPSATEKFTPIVVGLFSSGPSSVPATPSAQSTVPESVSQNPCALPCSLTLVTVRPAVPVSVAISVASSAPSAPSTVLPCPTRSRTLPLYATVIDTGPPGGGGGGGALMPLRVTIEIPFVPVWPTASRAVTVSVCVPSTTTVVSNVNEIGP